MKSTDSVIVSWDFSRGKDVGVLIVGSQKNGQVDVINAYQGKEAYGKFREAGIMTKMEAVEENIIKSTKEKDNVEKGVN